MLMLWVFNIHNSLFEHIIHNICRDCICIMGKLQSSLLQHRFAGLDCEFAVHAQTGVPDLLQVLDATSYHYSSRACSYTAYERE